MADTGKIGNERDDSEVFCLDCSYCDSRLCSRGMKSFLVADENMELFSTDEIDRGYLDLTDEKYHNDKCKCLIQNLACLQCGNVVGYFVKLPCHMCLQSPNNGHYWMFNTGAVKPSSRINDTGTGSVLWDQLPTYEQDCVWGNCMWDECER